MVAGDLYLHYVAGDVPIEARLNPNGVLMRSCPALEGDTDSSWMIESCDSYIAKHHRVHGLPSVSTRFYEE